MPDHQPISFEDRVFSNLRPEYPDLDEGFIRRHSKELMDLLALRDKINPSLLDSIDARARQIPDYLPNGLFPESLFASGHQQSAAEPGGQQTTNHQSATNRQTDCMRLLNLFMQKAVNGEIRELCVQAIGADGNHMMMFTLPANLFAFHGFMGHTINTYLQGGYQEFRDPQS